jgi:hypothetical protein
MFAASKSAQAAAAAAATDPLFPYVPLLLNTTSTNGQQNNTFLDSSTNNFTITRNGTPTQGSVTPYWPDGQWSWYFGGSGNYATTNTGGIGSTVTTFTIECWIFPTATPAGTTPAVIGDMQSTNISNYLSFGVTPSNLLQLFWYDGTTKTATGNTTIPLNTWTHIAASVNSNAITLYVNGVSQTITGTSTLTNRTGTHGYFVLAQNLTNIYTGYISNVSVLNGTAKYSSSFTPSTTPLSVSATNQTLLACYSNRFIDSNTATTAKTITVTGTPRVQAFQPFSPAASYTAAAYGGSGYFNGSTDYLTAPNNAALALGSGDFTVECWVYVSNNSAAYFLIECRNSAADAGFGFYLEDSSGYKLKVYRNSAQLLVSSAVVVPNTWNHCVFTRSSGVSYLYLNGVQTAFASDSNTYIQAGTLKIGVSVSIANYFPGYISNLRIVKGTAVYTANFTPPTAPVTAITNTSLLTNFTNAGIYDAAVQNNVITVGDAQASTTVSKWSPTSIKFDGTGDWLTAIDNPQLQLGTGDFTIDGWVYLSATGVAYGIISKGTASTGWSVNVTSGNKLQFSYTSSNLTGATSLAATTWYYFAVVRSGSATGNLKVYLNGTADATSGGAVTDNFNQTSILYTGADRVGTSPLNGYLQDVRVTKYARTITTPTAAFPTR